MAKTLSDYALMDVLSSLTRSCLIATPGKKMPIADLSNIEGRGLAWLAEEQWKLDAFSEFDQQKLASGGWINGFDWAKRTRQGEVIDLALDKKGEPIHRGHDLYALAYAKSFGITPEAVMDNKKNGDGSMRQIGKVQELALGYEGGVGAFVTFATGYGIDLDELGPLVLEAADQGLVNEARGMYSWLMDKKKGKNTYGLLPDTWVACDVIKRGWRLAHPQVSSWWKQLEQAFRDAIDNPGVAFQARTVTCHRPLLKSGKPSQWTTIVLPSGRRLCYPGARIEQETGEVSYMGVNQFNRKWSRIKTYSGKLAENVTQAFARDVLAFNMPLIEERGYEIVLSVHDELLTETPDEPEYSSDRLAAWMANVPPWATGLPLAAAGFETYRYRKD
jgi:DNA polymerase